MQFGDSLSSRLRGPQPAAGEFGGFGRELGLIDQLNCRVVDRLVARRRIKPLGDEFAIAARDRKA